MQKLKTMTDPPSRKNSPTPYFFQLEHLCEQDKLKYLRAVAFITKKFDLVQFCVSMLFVLGSIFPCLNFGTSVFHYSVFHYSVFRASVFRYSVFRSPVWYTICNTHVMCNTSRIAMLSPVCLCAHTCTVTT